MSSSATLDIPQEKQESFSFEDKQNASFTSPSADQKSKSSPCFQLKGSLVPMTAIELLHFEEAQFEQELKTKTAQAPGFFENLPVVIGLEKLDGNEHIPFDEVLEICARFSIKVVAIRGGSETQQAYAKKAGIGVLAKQKDKTSEIEALTNATQADATESSKQEPVSPNVSTPAQTNTEQTVKTVEVVKTVVETERQISKIIDHPIRSGQQVYASDGDLIVLASVSAGAEILADGNIHVYGALRGRALAGVKGDTSARIFCHSLAAELVSVAGQYKISEDIDRKAINRPAQVYLEDDALKFKPLEL